MKFTAEDLTSAKTRKDLIAIADKKDIKISEYITKLIRNDLGLMPETRPLIHGIDWELE